MKGWMEAIPSLPDLEVLLGPCFFLDNKAVDKPTVDKTAGITISQISGSARLTKLASKFPRLHTLHHWGGTHRREILIERDPEIGKVWGMEKICDDGGI